MPTTRSKWLAVTLTASALFLTGCAAAGSPSVSSATDVLTIGVADGYATFDPALIENGPNSIYWTTVYDTLLQRDADGIIQPGAAESWSYDDTNTVLTLVLRPGMTFASGAAVDAAAAAATIERTRDGSGSNASYLSAVAETVIVDDLTLELHLSAAEPALVTSLTSVPGIVADPAQFDNADIGTVPIGSGPYILDVDETDYASEFTFTKNEDYWDADGYEFDSVELRVLEDITARVNALKSGQIDAARIDAATATEAESSGLSLMTNELDIGSLIIMDRAGEMVPALADVRVRQAMNMAFDRESIVDNLLFGYGTPTDQQFGALSALYVDELEGNYDYDVEAARALMAEAGYADGFELTLPATPWYAQYEPSIQAALEGIGITVNWESVASADIYTRFLAGDFPVVWFTLDSKTTWEDITVKLQPDSVWNPDASQSDELSSLLAAAREDSENEDSEVFQEIGTYLYEEAWFVPVLRIANVTAYSDSVELVNQPDMTVPPVRSFSPAD